MLITVLDRLRQSEGISGTTGRGHRLPNHHRHAIGLLPDAAIAVPLSGPVG